MSGDLPSDLPGVEYDRRSQTGRAPAYRYADLRSALDDRDVAYEDHVCSLPSLSLSTAYDLRDYQQAALDAWREAEDRAVSNYRPGAARPSSASRRWSHWGRQRWSSSRPSTCWSSGSASYSGSSTVSWRIGGGEQRVEAITVSTYDSAYLRADELGDRFGLVVFDEVHHLGGQGYRDIARLLAAPPRLGLTATFERPA